MVKDDFRLVFTLPEKFAPERDFLALHFETYWQHPTAYTYDFSCKFPSITGQNESAIENVTRIGRFS